MTITTLLALAATLAVAVNLVLALAHALEYPGKLRLDDESNRKVQAIYYPGFTYGGLVGELGGVLLLAALLLALPVGGAFWWFAAALVLQAAVHAVYWLVTHPVNNFWVEGVATSKAASFFFVSAASSRTDTAAMRRQWEVSHILRSGLAGAGLICALCGLIAFGNSVAG